MYDSIVRAAAALTAGRTTAEALLDFSLDAIAVSGALTNAFVTVDADGARRAARRADAERAAGHSRGPLHGIPISLKDLIDVTGVVTTAGSRVLADRVAPRDAVVVTRLREAGAVVIGRTNLHEFALGTTSEHSAFGPVRHPVDPRRSAGGSSGGLAAAVATGMGLASIGTDTGGSIRIPAAACGVVGLKATAGEIPTEGVVPLSPSLDHVGPIARTVEDAAWLYVVLAGRPRHAVAPTPAQGLRLTRLSGYFAAPIDEDVRTAYEQAIERLASAGAIIGEADLPHPERIADAYPRLVLPEAAHWHGRYLDERRGDYTPEVHARLAHGRTYLAVDYLAARATCADLAAAVDALFGESDALVLTLPIVAPRLGADTIAIGGSRSVLPVRTAMLKHTQLFNMTGHPAITLPVAATGLPVGLQIVGRRGATTQLLDVAAGCEQVLGRDA